MAVVDYPSTLPCARLAGNVYQSGRTALRSEFDYGIRVRKQYCAQYQVGFTFIMSSNDQMKAWKDFYYNTLNSGVKTFNADFEIEGISGTKEFRFADVYTPTALGAGKFQVSASFDLLTSIKDL